MKQKNRERLESAQAARRIGVLLSSNVKRIDPDRVVVDQQGKALTLKNDAIIVSAGGVLPTPFLKEIGILVETKHGTA